MRRDKLSIAVSICMAAVVLLAVFIGYSLGRASMTASVPTIAAAAVSSETPSEASPSTIPTPSPTESPMPSGLGGGIAVPGFDRLKVEGATLHAESISNPERNDCYFVVSLYLLDGTEIYRSAILLPGQSVGAVNLPRPPKAGKYEGAIARYYCYARDTMQSLNGADITFTLEVLP